MLGRSRCPPHCEHCEAWNSRGWSGSESSSTCLSFVAVSSRYDEVSCSSCTRTKKKGERRRQGTNHSAEQTKTTHRMHLLARRPYAREQPVLHKPDARHLVPAQHLHDHKRRQDPALLNHAQNLAEVMRMPRHELRRLREEAQRELVQLRRLTAVPRKTAHDLRARARGTPTVLLHPEAQHVLVHPEALPEQHQPWREGSRRAQDQRVRRVVRQLLRRAQELQRLVPQRVSARARARCRGERQVQLEQRVPDGLLVC